MLFEYRYFGATAIASTASSTGLSFAPDVRRDPTYLRGQLRQKLPFRECMSALHAVVVSDLRFVPRDKSAYLAWRAQQEDIDHAELAATRRENKAQLAALTAELGALRAKASARRSPFDRAKRQFFDWLYKRNLDAWVVLDPVITVHPDEVAFECFSQDESSYGRVACSHEVFAEMGELAYGTTNVDYSYALYDEFQKIRDYKTTALTVDPAGFEVRTEEDDSYREVKIDLPDSWVRGFLQVGTAMTLPGATRLRLHPMDVHNLCFALRRRKEDRGPRSLRFVLDPGQPVRVRVEPFDLVLDFPRSPYEGKTREEVRVWGRRRLLTLERLIPVARSFEVVLLGTGMPSFWIADCGDIAFTLGLSGWTANDWSSSANFDLLAPRGEVDSATAGAVWDALAGRWLATTRELSMTVGRDAGTVEAAMVGFAQAGRAMYDLRRGVWRRRELARDPLDMATLRFSNPREEEAAALVRERGVLVSASDLGDGRVQLTGRVGKDRGTLVLDADRRLRSGECTCSFHFQNKLRLGPCTHLLAMRLAHERKLGGEIPAEPSKAPRTVRRPGPTRQGRNPMTGALIEVPRGTEGEGFVALLLERELVELSVAGRRELVAEVDRILRLERTASGRAQRLYAFLERSPAVEEHYVDDPDTLTDLFREWDG